MWKVREGSSHSSEYHGPTSHSWASCQRWALRHARAQPVGRVGLDLPSVYFNLYFKDHKYTGSKFILLKRRRNLLRRIHVSNAEIKHTNNKAIITLYTLNREKNVLKKKYLKINKKISKKLIAKRYFLLYKKSSFYLPK